MQLVGAGLCSARQDTPNYRKSSANPYALTRLAVEPDAHIGPAECTVFTGIYGEFVTSQWADRVVGPYGALCKFTAAHRAEQSPAPTNCIHFRTLGEAIGYCISLRVDLFQKVDNSKLICYNKFMIVNLLGILCFCMFVRICC